MDTEALNKYLEVREAQRAERLDLKIGELTEREFQLVREAAVLGYVHGNKAPRHDRDYPRDGDILTTVLLASDSFSDLYPGLAGLGD